MYKHRFSATLITHTTEYPEHNAGHTAPAALDEYPKANLYLQQFQRGDETPCRRHRCRVGRLVERKRHVGIREKPERLRQERLLSDPEERALEAPRAQKAESLQLGDQVRSGPHPRCSPLEATGGLANKPQ